MLTLILPAIDEQAVVELHFEHSLVSLSKWESKHKRPFYSNNEKNPEEFGSYVECMLISDNAPEDFVSRLTQEHYEAIRNYINESQTATTFREDPNEPKSREIITAEIIYYWLVAFRIPFHPVETWHLSRLMTLVRVCGAKQAKPKKMSNQQRVAEYKRLNEQRRREMGTNG